MVCTCLCFPNKSCFFFFCPLCFVRHPRGEQISWGHFQERMMLVCLESSVSRREIKKKWHHRFFYSCRFIKFEWISWDTVGITFSSCALQSFAAKTVIIVRMVLRQLQSETSWKQKFPQINRIYQIYFLCLYTKETPDYNKSRGPWKKMTGLLPIQSRPPVEWDRADWGAQLPCKVESRRHGVSWVCSRLSRTLFLWNIKKKNNLWIQSL